MSLAQPWRILNCLGTLLLDCRDLQSLLFCPCSLHCAAQYPSQSSLQLYVCSVLGSSELNHPRNRTWFCLSSLPMPSLPTSAFPWGCACVVVSSLAQDKLYTAPRSMTPPAFPQHAHPPA